MGNLKVIRIAAIAMGVIALVAGSYLTVIACAGVVAWSTIKAKQQD